MRLIHILVYPYWNLLNMNKSPSCKRNSFQVVNKFEENSLSSQLRRRRSDIIFTLSPLPCRFIFRATPPQFHSFALNAKEQVPDDNTIVDLFWIIYHNNSLVVMIGEKEICRTCWIPFKSGNGYCLPPVKFTSFNPLTTSISASNWKWINWLSMILCISDK